MARSLFDLSFLNVLNEFDIDNPETITYRHLYTTGLGIFSPEKSREKLTKLQKHMSEKSESDIEKASKKLLKKELNKNISVI